jgi:RNA polymerase sigma-70 factor (ECF subfamily)
LFEHNDQARARQVMKRAGSSQVEQWIAEARSGSTAAMGQLLEGCRKYLMLVATRSLDSDLRPKASASDLVQETCYEAQRDFEQFRGNTEQEFLAWLAGIVANRLANHERSYRGTHKRNINREIPFGEGSDRLEVDGCVKTPSELITAREDEQRVRAALDRLPEAQRRVLAMRSWERASFAEIGIALNVSADAARKQWSRALQNLCKELSKTNP